MKQTNKQTNGMVREQQRSVILPQTSFYDRNAVVYQTVETPLGCKITKAMP